MISLAQLCGQVGTDLQPFGGTRVPRRQLTGVHISELPDPLPYLEGGELLLSTGIPVAGSAEATAGYVRRLAAGGVAALGLGLGAGLDTVPPALAEACADADLALLVVPDGVPFRNISRAYWDLVARTGQADLAASLGTQTALARAATRPDARASVLKALAQALGGWAAYLPADGGKVTCWPQSASALVPRLREETSRLNTAATHSAATFQLHGADVVEHPILLGRRLVGFLAIGAGRKLTRADRQVILTVCVLLSLREQQEQHAADTEAVLDAAVAKLVLRAHPVAARTLAAELGRAPLAEQVRVLVLRPPAGTEALPAAADLARIAAGLSVPPGTGTPWPALGPAVARARFRYLDSGLACLLLPADARSDAVPLAPAGAAPGAASGPRADAPAGAAPGTAADVAEWAGALSEAVPLDRAADQLAATCAAAGAAAPGTLAMSAGLLDPRVSQWVAALQAYDRADLVGTVRAYLRHRGQWEPASRELGVHRNSLRHRIGVAGRLLDADLDDPDVAASLWLALRSLSGPAAGS
ncbi:Purine catabolism regulatory protein-like family protein [Arthrobacter saudimassiliensis]|uniref:Purine catabolism regulatory protein-like family protein n=1 Tax=Arthrobacter saudimassiliensis TaxID=1461584 RepID=A0A078MWR4_9MICC|nr:Purine catabolism regulatory protein-like family protein [Arthrobacter saudimassiliensis]